MTDDLAGDAMMGGINDGDAVSATSGPDFVISDVDADHLLAQPVVIAVPQAVFRVEGSGALDCVQGIYTNDVIKCAPDALLWGGVLTAKGMIIFDMWVKRDDNSATLFVPASSRTTAAALLRRTFPPRIARVTDATESHDVHWLTRLPANGLWPESLTPAGPAPFAALLLRLPDSAHAATPAPPAWLHAVRTIRGWPATGFEIDDRTLPQEVRFDELGGVRYDKGCYTGQETVARLHFRGHPNRMLRGLRWDGAPPSHRDVTHADRRVGTVSTWGMIGRTAVGLSRIRREIEAGDVVQAGGAPATVVDFPITMP